MIARFAVSSSDGTLYGPFDTVDAASEYAGENEEDLGDWNVKEIYGFENPDSADAWKSRELCK